MMNTNASMANTWLPVTLCAAMGLFAPQLVQAGASENLIVVNTSSDVIDAFDGACSLREAIQAANTNSAISPLPGECAAGSSMITDVIVLQAGEAYLLDRSGTGDTEGDLDIFPELGVFTHLEIRSDGQASAFIVQTIQGERVIDINAARVRIENLEVIGGRVPTSVGGGIRNQGGNLELEGVRFNDNQAQSGGALHSTGVVTMTGGGMELNSVGALGGGFANAAGAVALLDGVTLRANQAASGGAVHNRGQLEIRDSTITLNSGASATLGGGAIAHEDDATLLIVGTRFEGNSSNGPGGALNTSAAAGFEIRTSEFVNNSASTGGALRSTSSQPLTLIRNTLFDGNSATDSGGAIHGQVRVADAVFQNNRSVGGFGGAIFGPGSASLERSEFVNNEAGIDGGALFVRLLFGSFSAAPASDLLFQGNQAGANGGAIASGNWLDIRRARFIDNSAGNDGGAIHFVALPGTIRDTDLHQVVMTGNTATNQGGAMWLESSRSIIISNATISGNSASLGFGGVVVRPGTTLEASSITLANHLSGDLSLAGALRIKNSIIATPGQPNCSLAPDVSIVSLGSNIVDDASCSGIGTGLGQGSDQVGVDPMLAPLADNGGQTLTHALLPGSPAIGAGNSLDCSLEPVSGIDQRGAVRQIPGCDIGAHEQNGLLDVIFADDFETQ